MNNLLIKFGSICTAAFTMLLKTSESTDKGAENYKHYSTHLPSDLLGSLAALSLHPLGLASRGRCITHYRVVQRDVVATMAVS